MVLLRFRYSASYCGIRMSYSFHFQLMLKDKSRFNVFEKQLSYLSQLYYNHQ